MSLLSSLEMGGYAAYVWSAYGIFGVVIFAHLIACTNHKKTARLQLKKYFNKV